MMSCFNSFPLLSTRVRVANLSSILLLGRRAGTSIKAASVMHRKALDSPASSQFSLANHPLDCRSVAAVSDKRSLSSFNRCMKLCIDG